MSSGGGALKTAGTMRPQRRWEGGGHRKTRRLPCTWATRAVCKFLECANRIRGQISCRHIRVISLAMLALVIKRLPVGGRL
jgi:hypothetical protein